MPKLPETPVQLPLIRDGACRHGLLITERCTACINESKKNQPAWKDIEKLNSQSKYTRSNETSSNCTIEYEGKKYTIEHVESGDAPVLSRVQEMLVKAFGEEEVDPEEILRSAVNGETPFGTKDEVKCKVFVIKDEKGKVISTAIGGHLDFHDAEGKPTGETMLMIGYVLTDNNIRQSGLAREAYISMMTDAAIEAEKTGKKFTLMCGEASWRAEPYLNKLGRKRVYIQQKKGAYKELPYYQPALDFDTKTGEVADGAGEAAEHLMVRPMDRKTPSKEKMAQMVSAFFRWCNRWPPQAFENKGAYEKHKAYVDRIEGNFNRELESGGQLIFLDKKGRDVLRGRGITVQEHTDADHGMTSKEDE